MRLTLYYNSSERRVVGKSLQSAGTVTGILKDNDSILNPTFILEANDNYLSNINYLYWHEAGRYYFIDDILLMTGSRMVLSCSVDVLESFKVGIKAQNAVIDKQENIGRSNLFINDGSFVLTEQSNNQIINFSSGFNNNGEFILINAGA